MREMNPRQVSYRFIDDLYIYAQLDIKPDIIELMIVTDIYVILYNRGALFFNLFFVVRYCFIKLRKYFYIR